MELVNVEKRVEKEYHVSWYIIVYKLLFGVSEMGLGVGITFFGAGMLKIYRLYTLRELSEDPHDLVARLTESIIPNVFAHHTFLAIYLLVLGGAKIAGAIGLLYHKHWGVDVLVALTIILFPFQFIRLLLHPSIPDFIYLAVGVFVGLYLINFRPRQWATRVAKQVRRRSDR